jgi:hypothetical protein
MSNTIEKWLEPTLDFISETSALQSCKAVGIPFVENRSVNIFKNKNQFDFSFLSPLAEYSAINQAKTTNLDQFTIATANSTYVIPAGSLITSYRDCFDEEQGFNCVINSQLLHTEGFNIGENYYFRYVVPIGEQTISFRDYAFYHYDYHSKGRKGWCFDLIKIFLNEREFHFWGFKEGNDSFLIVDSLMPCTLEMIDKIALSILVSHGFLCSSIYLNEAYIIYGGELDFKTPTGIYYKSLRNSIKGQYTIFTTNAYSVLVPIGKNKDSIHGESEAIEKIKKEDWINKLGIFKEETFSKLVNIIHNNESVLRAAMTTVEASKFAIDIQLAMYCVAFETLSKQIMKIHQIKPSTVIEKNIWKNQIRPLFVNAIKAIQKDEQIKLSEEQFDFLDKKINSLNNPTNKDTLKLPFEWLGYNLSEEELTCIDYRNLSLHGILPIEKDEDEIDKLFYVNLMMHKLCSVLILKLAGFEGYIINNIKLHEKNINRVSEDAGFLKI